LSVCFVLTNSIAGTAILSKHKPLSVETTIPGHPDPEDVKGRIITLEFASCYLVGTYVVNAGQKLQASFFHSSCPENRFLTFSLKTLGAKNIWNKHFFAYLNLLDGKKPVIWAGDLNVAPTERGLGKSQSKLEQDGGIYRGRNDSFQEFPQPPCVSQR
jgi:AP endonuclease-1